MTVARILDADLPYCQLGEGARWDPLSASLYWVDILECRIHRYGLEAREHRSWQMSKEVSFAYPTGDRLTLCLRDGVYDFDPETGTETPIALLELPHDHRLNDGKLDPQGRLWVGTINTGKEPLQTAALYVLRGDRLEEIEGGYVNANGKGWSPDGRIMYHADTSRSTIWEYDYDLGAGTVSNKRVFAKFGGEHPDGLCVDGNGFVYAAIYGGSRVDIRSHRGNLVGAIEVPAPNVTSCALGGPDMRTLFITTAFDGMDETQRAAAPLSGQIFVANIDHISASSLL